MIIRIKSTGDTLSIEAIKILRQYTSYSMEEIKKRFENHQAIFEFDFYDENRKTLFQVIEALKTAGVPLEFYEADENVEDEITESMIQNLFDSSDHYADQIDRETEMHLTEIVVTTSDEIHQVFEYTNELMDFLSKGKDQPVNYFQRSIDDQIRENWEEITAKEIRDLMGITD